MNNYRLITTLSKINAAADQRAEADDAVCLANSESILMEAQATGVSVGVSNPLPSDFFAFCATNVTAIPPSNLCNSNIDSVPPRLCNLNSNIDDISQDLLAVCQAHDSAPPLARSCRMVLDDIQGCDVVVHDSHPMSAATDSASFAETVDLFSSTAAADTALKKAASSPHTETNAKASVPCPFAPWQPQIAVANPQDYSISNSSTLISDTLIHELLAVIHLYKAAPPLIKTCQEDFDKYSILMIAQRIPLGNVAGAGAVTASPAVPASSAAVSSSLLSSHRTPEAAVASPVFAEYPGSMAEDSGTDMQQRDDTAPSEYIFTCVADGASRDDVATVQKSATWSAVASDQIIATDAAAVVCSAYSDTTSQQVALEFVPPPLLLDDEFANFSAFPVLVDDDIASDNETLAKHRYNEHLFHKFTNLEPQLLSRVANVQTPPKIQEASMSTGVVSHPTLEIVLAHEVVDISPLAVLHGDGSSCFEVDNEDFHDNEIKISQSTDPPNRGRGKKKKSKAQSDRVLRQRRNNKS